MRQSVGRATRCRPDDGVVQTGNSSRPAWTKRRGTEPTAESIGRAGSPVLSSSSCGPKLRCSCSSFGRSLAFMRLRRFVARDRATHQGGTLPVMDARNRTIPLWFSRIRTGQVLLPRFQRFQAWSHSEVGALLEAVLRDLPSGAALVLEVGDVEPFISRKMIGTPDPTERCTEHLLDGQQRLTALWRSLHDDYEDRTWLIRTEFDEEHDREKVVAFGQSRWMKGNQRYPLWVDNPAELWARRFIPVRLLQPEEIMAEIRTWADAATGDDLAASRDLETEILALRG